MKKLAATAIVGVALAGHAGCGGKLADVDEDATANPDASADAKGDGAIVCTQFAYPPSNHPYPLYEVTCPTLWRCDLFPFDPTSQTSDRGFVTCCPPGTQCQPLPCSPRCAKCDCIQTCCPEGMWCDDWDAAPRICDGG